MGSGLRYGLLAALTLVLASALVWDRLHPPAGNRLEPREPPRPADTLLLIVGHDPPPVRPRLPGPAGSPAADGGTAASPAEALAPAEDLGTWTVQRGDTLGAIALQALGTSRRAGEIARLNGMALDSVLREGAVLRLPAAVPGGDPRDLSGCRRQPDPGGEPPAAGAKGGEVAATPADPAPKPAERRCHTVARGETLSAIARRYYGKPDFRRLLDANGMSEDDVLRPGQEIVVP